MKLSPNSHTQKRDWDEFVGVLSEDEDDVEEGGAEASLEEWW